MRGATDTSAHSATSRRALAANASEKNVAGERARRPRALTSTSPIDSTAVAMTIAGSDVTSRLSRYRASRVALPAMNCAVTVPAQNMAVATAAPGRGPEDLIWVCGEKPMQSYHLGVRRGQGPRKFLRAAARKEKGPNSSRNWFRLRTPGSGLQASGLGFADRGP